MYQAGDFKHIPSCCYLYRVHGENAWLKHNADIQAQMVEVQESYIQSMAEVWAERNGSKMLDLGGRFNCPPNYTSVDKKDSDIVCDLNKPWPFEDSSVGVIRAFDVVEHLDDIVFIMREIHRVLMPGGYVFISVPSSDGRGAFQDPTHKLFLNQNSFYYYTRAEQAQYIDNTDIRFKPIVLKTHFPNQWCVDNNIPYVRCDMLALKDGYKPMGTIDI